MLCQSVRDSLWRASSYSHTLVNLLKFLNILLLSVLYVFFYLNYIVLIFSHLVVVDIRMDDTVTFSTIIIYSPVEYD